MHTEYVESLICGTWFCFVISGNFLTPGDATHIASLVDCGYKVYIINRYMNEKLIAAIDEDDWDGINNFLLSQGEAANV